MTSNRRPNTPTGRGFETIIIGAGMAGEACARRLTEARRPFLLISEDSGGRMRRSRDGKMNLGAFYVRADYEHVNRLVNKGRRINSLRTLRHAPDGSYTFSDPRLLSHLPQAGRFIYQVQKFRRHYQRLKTNCLLESQAAAIRSDPYLWFLYQEPAAEFIERHSLRATARNFLGPGLHGTTFLPLRQLTGFTALLGALPLLVPIYEFTRRSDGNDRWARSVLFDRVTRITREREHYLVNTQQGGSFITNNVVVATPPHVSRRLLGLPHLKNPVLVHSFEISGRLRHQYSRADVNLFTDDSPVCAIAQQANGSILLSSREEQPNFDDYLAEWEVIEHREWNPAFNLIGTTLLECELAPNLFVVGDHNICGLEDAYLTGHFAAHEIIHRRPQPIPQHRPTDALPHPPLTRTQSAMRGA